MPSNHPNLEYSRDSAVRAGANFVNIANFPSHEVADTIILLVGR
jgi:hypothetical protein